MSNVTPRTADRYDWAIPVVRGIGWAAALFAVLSVVLPLSGAAALTSARSAWALVLTLCGYALVTAALAATGLARLARYPDNPPGWIPAISSVLAIVGLPTVVVCAHALSSQRTVLTQLEARPVALFALLGAIAGGVAAGCVAVIGRQNHQSDTVRHQSRRDEALAGLTTFLVASLVSGTLLSVAPPAPNMEPAPLALAVPVPPYPTSLGNVAYRIRQTDELRNTAVRVGGPGFIIATPRAIRAHDGTTGEVRWEVGAADLHGLDSSDASESIAVFGYGDDATVMIVGTDITIGLDATTGRLLWRSAAPEFRPTSHDYAPQRAQVHVEHPSTVDEKPKPPRMVVLDPRRGTIRWQTELSCQPGYDSTEKFVVTSVCGKPAEFEITDIESRTTRRIRLTTPTNGRLTAPAYLGEGLFGAFYRTAVPHRDRATSFDEGTAMFVTVFDAATGAEVDHFELTSRISSVNGGFIAMGTDYSKRTGVYGQVIFRNLQTRKSSSVPVRVQGSDFDSDWLGGSLLVRGDGERGSVPLVVDPRTGTITRRGSACIDSLQDLQSVPGAVLEVCSGHDGPWGFEIVGLR